MKKTLSGTDKLMMAVPEGGRGSVEPKIVTPVSDVPAGVATKPTEEMVVPEVAALPQERCSVQHIGGWKGMNKRATFDSGALSEAVNVTFRDFPNVESCTLPEVVKTFKFTERVETEGTDEEGNATTTVTWEDKAIAKVYDCVTRGDELFLACDKGYVYGKVIDNKLCYIAIGDMRTTNAPKKSVRLVFVETHEDESISMTTHENVCVFNSGLYDGESNYMPVFPSGIIEIVDNFIPLLWNEDGGSDIDTSRIYVVVDEDGKAEQIWKWAKTEKYDGSAAVFAWCELRRKVFATTSDNYNNEYAVYFGYYDKNDTSTLGQSAYQAACKSAHAGSVTYVGAYVGYPLKRCDERAELKNYTIVDIDADINKEDIYADDNMCSTHVLGKTYTEVNENNSIFNYETTVAPKFENVTFYKGRVFGSVGSSVIASMHNSYNKWELDTTDDISSENAWMTTTTANANADGDIVAMREYLGRISVLKSGFMQEVYGGSNPFTIQDVYAVGTPFKAGVCEAYGRLCFGGRNAIRTYGGSFPRVIGDELGIDTYEDVQMLGDDRSVLIKSGDKVYKYDFILGMWEERRADCFADIGKMVLLDGGMHAVTNTGELVRLEGTDYGEWSFATDAMTESTLELKRLQKVRLTYELGANAEFSLFVIKSDGRELETVTRENKGEKTELQRCEFNITNAVDWFLKLRFTGKGYFKLISLDMEVKSGGAPTYE